MIKKNGLILAILLLMSVFNCGKKGPLVLEPALNPMAAENVQLSQVGDELKLMWSFPQAFTDKKKTPFDVEQVEKIYIYYADKEIPGDKFRKKASLLKKLTLNDLTKAPDSLIQISPLTVSSTTSSTSSSSSAATTGKREIRNLSYFITIPLKLKELDNKDHFLAVQYYYQKKRSPLSQVAYIHSMAPVKSVTDVKISQEKKVIKISWGRPTQDEAGNSVSSIAGYNMYRKIEPEIKKEGAPDTEASVFVKINKDKVLTEYYEDSDSGVNGTYSYYISGVVSNQVETSPSQTVSIKISDIYPPEVPANLVCFKAPDHLFLTWKPSPDSDFAHYRVYRRSADEVDSKLIADKITASSYKDKDVQKGKTYIYTVSAVDQKGNESDQSNEVSEQF